MRDAPQAHGGGTLCPTDRRAQERRSKRPGTGAGRDDPSTVSSTSEGATHVETVEQTPPAAVATPPVASDRRRAPKLARSLGPRLARHGVRRRKCLPHRSLAADRRRVLLAGVGAGRLGGRPGAPRLGDLRLRRLRRRASTASSSASANAPHGRHRPCAMRTGWRVTAHRSP